jgi:MoaA/NifB/PqqE/SkfB family radical SAM enzyme
MQSRPFPILPCDAVDAEQLEWHGTTEDLTPLTPVHHVFRSHHNRLYRLEVYLETHARTNHCHLWLSLHEGTVGFGDRRTAPVRLVGPLAAESLAGPGWFAFEFLPLPASAGRTYTAVFESPDALLGSSVALRAAEVRRLPGPRPDTPGEHVLLFRTTYLKAPRPLENFRRFRDGFDRFDPSVTHHPLMARLEVSRPCDLHCIMCLRGLNPFDPSGGAAAFMRLETFRALDPILPDLLWVIGFGLGEPLLNPDLLPILRHLRSVNDWADVFVSTNGTHLHRPFIEAVVGEDLLSTCQVSIDGATARTYEAVRRHGRHGEVVGNLRALVRERDRRGARQLTVKTEMLVMQPTAAEVLPFIRQMADLGVDRIVLDSPKGAEFRALRVDDDDGMERICEQVRLGHELLAGSRSRLDGPLLWELMHWHRKTGRTGAEPPACIPDLPAIRTRRAAPSRSPCALPWESCYLEADGTMRVCYNSARLLDHARSGNLQQAWTGGDGYRRLRTELTGGSFHEHCASCLKAIITRVENLRTPPTYLDACCSDAEGGAARLAASPGEIRLDQLPLPAPRSDGFLPSAPATGFPGLGARFKRAKTPAVPDARSGLHGYVDEVVQWGDRLALRGWARDARHGRPVERVVFTVNGRLVPAKQARAERPDVLSAWGGNDSPHGFMLEMPLRSLRGTGPWKIGVWAYRGDRPTALGWHDDPPRSLRKLRLRTNAAEQGFRLNPQATWAWLTRDEPAPDRWRPWRIFR